MNIKDAKMIPLAQILAIIGYNPERMCKGESIYYSPLRNERTPSFHVNDVKNAWYDFGEGRGGNILDFVCAYLGNQKEASTVHDALRWLSNMAGSAASAVAYDAPPAQPDASPSLTVRQASRINHKALVSYLKKRGIPLLIAATHLDEVNIYNAESHKHFFALGMRNEDAGHEIRNPFFKGCAGTKAISFVRGMKPKPDGIHLFEGMFDFLSVLAVKNARQLDGDAIILHSVSCLKQVFPYIVNYGYRSTFTWFDNDKATFALQEICKAEAGLQLPQ